MRKKGIISLVFFLQTIVVFSDSMSSVSINGDVFFIIEVDDEWIVGYRDYNSVFWTQSILLTSNEMRLGDRVQGRAEFMEKYGVWRAEQDLLQEKYEEEIRTLRRRSDLFIYSDPFDRVMTVGLWSIDEYNDRILFLYQWDDGHSLAATQVIIMDQDGHVLANKYLSPEELHPFASGVSAVFIDESTIIYEQSHHNCTSLIVSSIDELMDVSE